MIRLPSPRPLWLSGAALLCGGAALFPVLSDASSSVQRTPEFELTEERKQESAHDERFHIHRPGSITLAEVIELQRQRRALKPVEAAAGVGVGVGAEPGSGGWEAQLGAFGSAMAAARQQARLPALSLPVAVYREGALFRLKSAAAEPAAAQAFCRAAVAAGFDCFVRRREGV